ncbi:MAG TPA: glycosyltransferase family 61 protein [Mucilaginibacter sp.]|jgi:capsular polysaccharide biosynthesis protein|nr:glycosyltransferase family 61 protein [Mucilaginibacter sp.]
MKKIINVPLPLNLSDKDKFMYEPYSSYELATTKIKSMKNVFVTFSGFCINNKGLIKECHHDYPFQHNYYLNEAAQYYYDATDQPENLVTLDNDIIYLTIHHPWFNYYHWICESIFRLWMVRRRLEKVVLILPEYYKNADFIMGSLEPFRITNIFYIPNGKSLMVKNLCLPQIKPLCDSYNAKHLKQVSNFYRNYVFGERRVKVDKIDKLYVSRELANRRKVINEIEIQIILKKYGFTIFHPEKFTFLEQVAIFSQVKYLVGEHGSGLTNLLFMEKGTSLLELHKNKTNEMDHPSPLFWYMAEALQINYYHQLCETHGKEDYFDGDYIVDADLFERNLIKMLN